MVYRVRLVKFFTAIYDHILRIQQAERFANIRGTSVFLILASALIYGWMAYLGIGSTLLSSEIVTSNVVEYESSKFWFLIGRVLYGALFAIAILLLPSLVYHLITEIPYQKLIIMQQMVLAVLLVERLIWIPLVLFVGLDWYVSPLSLGIIASYLTEIDWFIYFFGAITLFQGWIIWFQYRFLHTLSNTKSRTLWIFILLLHMLGWVVAATVAATDTYMISGWFD